MERSEPSLVPEWLKGSSGSSFPTSQPTSHQDDAVNSFVRHKSVQQIADVQTEFGHARALASSDRVYSPTVWRSPNGNTGNTLSRATAETENFVPGRLHHSLTQSASLNNRDDAAHSNGHRGDYQECEQESVRDIWLRTNGSLSVFGIDEKEKKSKEHPWTRKLQLSIPGKFDEDPKFRRTQSMGLSSKTSDSIGLKNGDAVGMTSPLLLVSGTLASSMQKSVFERNFPSLNMDEKFGGLPASPGNIASPRTAWQSSSRLDIGRAVSPGLSGGLGVSSNGGFVGIGARNLTLAETIALNGSSQNNRMGHDSSSNSSNNVGSTVSTMSNGTAVLNMSEALKQNPHRARTPPLLSMETQRLESLALKQSRQLIPMTPTLPKAMSLTDKSKSKGPRIVDATVTGMKSNQSSGSLQPVQRMSVAKADDLKHSQGKLFVLKSNKDGGSLMASSVPKLEGNDRAPIMPSRVTISSSNTFAQHKKPHDGLATSQIGLANLQRKDFSDQDKKSSIHAQNRSDFFNALRKKSTVKSVSDVQSKFDIVPENQGHETEEIGIDDPRTVRVSSQMDSSGVGLVNEHLIENAKNEVTMDSEEEEAAFMRSLGWEENAEGSELTEEEINAFYQMREKKKLHSSESQFSINKEHPVGSLESLSSSDSDLDEH